MRCRIRRVIFVSGIFLAFALAPGCGVKQSRFVPLGETYAARPEESPVDVYRTGRPERSYLEVSQLDVHLETRLGGSSFDDALPELKKQARLSGAEAVIDIKETRRWWGEVGIYHVTATGIVYAD